MGSAPRELAPGRSNAYRDIGGSASPSPSGAAIEGRRSDQRLAGVPLHRPEIARGPEIAPVRSLEHSRPPPQIGEVPPFVRVGPGHGDPGELASRRIISVLPSRPVLSTKIGDSQGESDESSIRRSASRVRAARFLLSTAVNLHTGVSDEVRLTQWEPTASAVRPAQHRAAHGAGLRERGRRGGRSGEQFLTETAPARPPARPAHSPWQRAALREGVSRSSTLAWGPRPE